MRIDCLKRIPVLLISRGGNVYEEGAALGDNEGTALILPHAPIDVNSKC
jgi:hypothetical protein